MYSIELSDGTKISNLKLNGDNFYSAAPISAGIFAGKLRRVKITSDDAEEQSYVGEHEHMRLEGIQHITKSPGLEAGYYFVLKEIPSDELERLKTTANIEYLAMMSDIDLEG